MSNVLDLNIEKSEILVDYDELNAKFKYNATLYNNLLGKFRIVNS
jgi:hypothetical protein